MKAKTINEFAGYLRDQNYPLETMKKDFLRGTKKMDLSRKERKNIFQKVELEWMKNRILNNDDLMVAIRRVVGVNENVSPASRTQVIDYYANILFQDKNIRNSAKHREALGKYFNFSKEDFEMLSNEELQDIWEAINRLDENIGGAGGAGYAVYGGGWGRSFGNPSMGGRFGGRGFGFGGSQNLSGGPNLMYTYDVKPLTQDLQPPATTQDDEESIHTGSVIRGHVLNTEEDIEGSIIFVEEDEDNNIKWYVVLDDEGMKRKVDPTTAYLVQQDEFIDPFMMDLVGDEDTKPPEDARGSKNESFYPSLTEKKKDEPDVKTQIERSRNIPKELKEKILPLVQDYTTYNSKGIVTNLKSPNGGRMYKGCGVGVDKDGWFVHTHRARCKSKPELDKIPEKDIKFIKSTG